MELVGEDLGGAPGGEGEVVGGCGAGVGDLDCELGGFGWEGDVEG